MEAEKKKKKFLLRMSPELWRELERWAQEDFRSVNGQVEFLLHDAVRRRRKGRAGADDAGGDEGPPEGGAG